MPLLMTFVKSIKGKGTRMMGKLKWPGDEYEVVSGGYGKGPIPDGMYEIKVNDVVVGNESSMRSGFINPITGRGWFIPLQPTFTTSRHGFGIHPDGNLPGTMGCLGLQGDDIKRFWEKWNRTPMILRPDRLLVATKG